MLDDLLDAAHDAGWKVTWNPLTPPTPGVRGYGCGYVVLHRRGALPIARFGTTLDEAAAQILTSAIFRAPATTDAELDA